MARSVPPNGARSEVGKEQEDMQPLAGGIDPALQQRGQKLSAGQHEKNNGEDGPDESCYQPTEDHPPPVECLQDDLQLHGMVKAEAGLLSPLTDRAYPVPA